MTKKVLLLLLCFIAGFVSANLVRTPEKPELHTRNSDGDSTQRGNELSRLRLELSQKEASIYDLTRQLDKLQNKELKTPDTQATPQREADSSSLSSGAAAIRSQMILASIENLLTVSDVQRTEIEEAISRAHQRVENGESEVSIEDDLQQILGPEAFEELKRERELFEQRIRSERTERELYTLSRKLALNSEQEQKMLSVLNEANELYNPESRFSQGFSRAFMTPDERAEFMRTYFENMKQRRAYIQQFMRPELNDQQMNSLIEAQENSARAQSHDRFLESLSRKEAQAGQNTEAQN